MLGKPPGVYVGPTHSGRRDVLFRVLYAPDDCELLRPLWNAGAEFTTWDVAGMVMDGGAARRYAAARCRRHRMDGARLRAAGSGRPAAAGPGGDEQDGQDRDIEGGDGMFEMKDVRIKHYLRLPEDRSREVTE